MDWQSTQSIVKSLGNIDLLVNNAGITEITPFIDVTSDTFDRQVTALFNSSNLMKQMVYQKSLVGV